jgi:hypothetical protein
MELGHGVELVDAVRAALPARGRTPRRQHPHPERLPQPGHLLPDAAQSQDAEGLPLDEAGPDGLAMVGVGALLGQDRQLFLDEHEHEEEAVLGDGQRVGARHVGEGDPGAQEARLLEPVDAGPDPLAPPELGRPPEQIGRDAGDEEDLDLAQGLAGLGPRLGGGRLVPEPRVEIDDAHAGRDGGDHVDDGLLGREGEADVHTFHGRLRGSNAGRRVAPASRRVNGEEGLGSGRWQS